MKTPALHDPSETNEADFAETGDREVVIAYTSKHLNEREAKWSTTEKECFAIVEHSQLPLHCKKKRLLVLNSQCISSVCLV
jgi:hypothetical protein